MLTTIRLENFKSWQKVEVEFKPLTLLYGTNSSGKSSILQVLLLLKQTVKSSDPSVHLNFADDKGELDFGNYKSLVYQHKVSRSIGIGLSWIASYLSDSRNELGEYEYHEHRQALKYDTSWRQIKGRVVLNELAYAPTDNKDWPPIKAKRKADGNYEYSFPKDWYQTTYPWEDVQESRRPWRPPTNCYALPSASVSRWDSYEDQYGEPNPFETDFSFSVYNQRFEQLFDRVLFVGPLREHPRRDYLWRGTYSRFIGSAGENTITALIAASRSLPDTQDLVDVVGRSLKEMGLAAQFGLKAIDRERRFYETLIATNESEIPSSLADVGFGVSQILPIITLLSLAPEGSIILIEQPELHLHPSAQAHLADLFLAAAEKRHLQLIVESHSEHLLRRLQRRIAEPQFEFATPDNIRAYFCESSPEGSQIRPVELDEYGQIRNWPANFFGDISGDLNAMLNAAIQRRRLELSNLG